MSIGQRLTGIDGWIKPRIRSHRPRASSRLVRYLFGGGQATFHLSLLTLLTATAKNAEGRTNVLFCVSDGGSSSMFYHRKKNVFLHFRQTHLAICSETYSDLHFAYYTML